MKRTALVLAAAAVLLAGCGGGDEEESSSLGAADSDACDALHEYGDDAIDGDPAALRSLAKELGSGGMNDDLPETGVYAQLVAGSALVTLSGGDGSGLVKDVGQMQGVCTSHGWHWGE